MNRACLLILCLCLGASAAAQTTRYVSDRLELPLRTGKSVKHRIVEMLPSGTPLQVLSVSDDGYAQVRTEEGKGGWVLARFLMDTPSARARLNQAEKRLATLELENTRLKTEVKTMTERAQSAEASARALTEHDRGLAQQLETIQRTASNALRIEAQNKTLKQDLIAKEKELQTLFQENVLLKDRAHDKWFMAGALVTLISFLIGFLLPKLSWQRRGDMHRF